MFLFIKEKPETKGQNAQFSAVYGFLTTVSIFTALSLLSMISCTTGPDHSAPRNLGKTQSTASNAARAYHLKAASAFRTGDFDSAVEYWEKAIPLYRKPGEQNRKCRTLIKLSAAYQALGMSNYAIDILKEAIETAEKVKNSYLHATALNRLAGLYTSLGQANAAQRCISQSLEIAGSLDNAELYASVMNHQGNIDLLNQRYISAIRHYSECISKAEKHGRPKLAITALVNCARAMINNRQSTAAESFLHKALNKTRMLDDSHFKTSRLIDLGISFHSLGTSGSIPEKKHWAICSDIFKQAFVIAETHNNQRNLSYALGYQGQVCEYFQQYDRALVLSRQACFRAHQTGASDSLYKWQWQKGRILNQLNRLEESISAYRETLYTLQSIRGEMENCRDIHQPSFRQTASQVCFELVDLLLEHTKTIKENEKRKSLLGETREILELLRVYELRNYFKDDCMGAVETHSVSLDTVSDTSVVVYPVILKDRMEIIVSLPDGLDLFSTPVNRKTLTREIQKFRHKLEKRTTREFIPHAEKLYDYLIRPFEPELSSAGIRTMVFIPAGPLRTIPLGALYDGNRFLVEKYATAVTPGLSLVNPGKVKREGLKLLAAGITKSSQGFPPLPEVASELKGICRLFPSRLLLNEDFQKTELEEELKKEEFNIVHIASHGQFHSDVDQTFILVYNGKLTISSLDQYKGFLQFRQTPLDLLVLSACESAAGDELAALGMAGVAVKSGAKSALATMWSINDMASSLLIKEFYHQLKTPSVSRAKALQSAKISLIDDPRYGHPGYWSAFLLINSWL